MFFFDYLNAFAIVYQLQTNFIVILLLTIAYILSLPSIIYTHFNWWSRSNANNMTNPITGSLKECGKLFVAFIVGILISLIVGSIIYTYQPFFYYSAPLFGICAFAFAALFGYCLVHFLFVYCAFKKGKKEPIAYSLWATSIFWTILLVICCIFAKTIGSTAIVFYPALFHFAGMLIHQAYEYVIRVKKPTDIHLGSPKQTDNPFARIFYSKEQEEATDDRDTSSEELTSHTNITSLQQDLFYICLFLFMTIIPYLWIFSSCFVIILHLSSDYPSLLPSAAIGFFTVFGIINFYPLARRANSFGSLSLVFLLGTVICLIVIAVFFVPTAYSPYHSYIVQNQDFRTKQNSITFRGTEDYLKRLVQNELKVPAAEMQCSVDGSYPFQKCVVNESVMLNITNVNYTVGQSANNELWIQVNASNCLVSTITITPPINQNLSIWIEQQNDTHYINNIQSSYAFYYFFPNDSPWRLYMNSTNPIQPLSITLSLILTWDDTIFSPAISNYIQQSPFWATFRGSGTGLANLFISELILPEPNTTSALSHIL